MPNRDLIVVGASAGGVEALTRLVHDLPADLPAAVVVVLHVPAHGTSVMPAILSRHGPLSAAHAVEEEPIVPGRIYVAPPDHHLLVKNGTVRLGRGPRENGHRPAVDPLFRTAARAGGRRVIGVVLSGALDDGTAGLVAIKERGGVTVVQDPDDALTPGMPRSAIEQGAVDHILPLAGIGPLLARLAAEPLRPEPEPPVSQEMDVEADMAELDLDALQNPDRPGVPSGFACPDCGGALFELHNGELIRFRCRVGHAWSPHSLLAEQSEALETALWTALRALEESAALAERLADRLRGHAGRASARFERQAHDARQRAALIQQVLVAAPPVEDVEPPPEGESPPREPDSNA
jgi:two-component system chemotaxis response regulator CheB